MDNWRQERLVTVNTSLKRIDDRVNKLLLRINPITEPHRSHTAQVSAWTEEVALLQELSDRLLAFKGRLFFYSHLAYIEAVNEWEHHVKR